MAFTIKPLAYSNSYGPRAPSHSRAVLVNTHPNPTTDQPARHHARMQQPRWQEEEGEEQQRLIESTQRALRQASDEEVLRMLESPRPPSTQGIVACAAALVGRGGLVLRALERGVLSPDTPCDGGTFVHVAAAHGPLALLKSLILERGVDPNEARTDSWRPLPLAIDGGREQEALFLINEAPGVDINAPTPSGGHTPLMLAARRGMVNVLRVLVAKGANVNAKNEQGLTALHAALCQQQEAAALYLVEEAATAVYDTDFSLSALAYVATFSLCRVIHVILRRMRADGVDSATVAVEMGAAAHFAIKKVESLKALLEEGLDVDQAPPLDRDGYSYELPLFHHACVYGNREAAALLVERGCDPLARNGLGQRAHHLMAVHEDGLPMLQWLMASFLIPLDEPAAIFSGVSGVTMLHFAATTGRLESAQWLVGVGADVLCMVQGLAGGSKRPSQLAETGVDGCASIMSKLTD